jgi:hypothetical protein
MQRRNFLLPACLALLSSVAAAAWTQTAEIEVKVHEHVFHKVTVEGVDCTLNTKLWFHAPAAVYSSANAARNLYRFHGRVDFLEGNQAPIAMFVNRVGGERYIASSYDTTAEGCWARDRKKLERVRLEACRGDGCGPRPVK